MATGFLTNNLYQNKQSKLHFNVMLILKQKISSNNVCAKKYGSKMQIKDNPMKKLLYYDTTIDGVRKKAMARFKKTVQRTSYGKNYN